MLWFGVQVMLIGMLTVFVGLTILIACMDFMGWLFHRIEVNKLTRQAESK